MTYTVFYVNQWKVDALSRHLCNFARYKLWDRELIAIPCRVEQLILLLIRHHVRMSPRNQFGVREPLWGFIWARGLDDASYLRRSVVTQVLCGFVEEEGKGRSPALILFHFSLFCTKKVFCLPFEHELWIFGCACFINPIWHGRTKPQHISFGELYTSLTSGTLVDELRHLYPY